MNGLLLTLFGGDMGDLLVVKWTVLIAYFPIRFTDLDTCLTIVFRCRWALGHLIVLRFL